MCTDNMPSGSAYKLGDVLTARGGTTVEIKNTDAEGRLAMMDALALAVEEGVDAVVDIATLTGAVLVALGQSTAGLFGNDRELVGQVEAAAAATDEPVWQLPLEKKYRKQLDSEVADISNLGGPYAGVDHGRAVPRTSSSATTPWAHIDIAGTMQVEADEAWRSKGATGFGARLLAEVARGTITAGRPDAPGRRASLLGDDVEGVHGRVGRVGDPAAGRAGRPQGLDGVEGDLLAGREHRDAGRVGRDQLGADPPDRLARRPRSRAAAKNASRGLVTVTGSTAHTPEVDDRSRARRGAGRPTRRGRPRGRPALGGVGEGHHRDDGVAVGHLDRHPAGEQVGLDRVAVGARAGQHEGEAHRVDRRRRRARRGRARAPAARARSPRPR